MGQTLISWETSARPDWNDVAEEDEVADGVSKNVIGSERVELSKIPVVRPVGCTFEKRSLSFQIFPLGLLGVITDINPVDQLETGGKGDLNRELQFRTENK